MNVKPFIFGISGTALTQRELEFFSHHKPFGYILFARNIESAHQLMELTQSLKSISNDPYVPILIDQEGGRVARILPPISRCEYPPAMYFTAIAKDRGLKLAKQAVYKSYYDLGCELMQFGVNANCAPVADLLHEGAHEVIGSRSFGTDVRVVVELCKTAVEALRAAGVQPILKHIPGHGRAQCDSHQALPKVDSALDDLQKTDFMVFKELSRLDCWSMTAHVLYTALDTQQCVTLSPKAISFIRSTLGYGENLIMTDDLSMGALSTTSSLIDNMKQAFVAGCDIVLHCSGDMLEMKQLIDVYSSDIG
jgi:beta-glucosidase-like glycosyl hydrolase